MDPVVGDEGKSRRSVVREINGTYHRREDAMNKLKQVALCLIILSIGGVAAAERPSAGFRPLDDAMRSMGYDPDEMRRQQDLIAWHKRLLVEEFSEPWVAAGCTVEGIGPLDRILCPGFRVDPKVAPELSVQFMVTEFRPLKPAKQKKQKKSDLEGNI
jgi:hypothetical protein